MNENKFDRAGLIVFLITVGVIVSAALVLLGASWLPFSMVRAWADKSAFDGSADFLTPARFRGAVVGVRTLAALLIVVSGIFLFIRGRVVRFFSGQLISFGRVAGRLRAFLGEIWLESETWHLAVLGIVVLAGVMLRWAFIHQPIRYDEANTFMEYASRPLYLGLTYYTSHNNHLFHTFLVHISYLIFGDALWAVRLPAFLAGVFMVPVSYLLFRALFDKRVALLTAAFVSISPLIVDFSTNARGYTLMALLYLLLMLLAVFLRRHREPAGWTLCAILAALGLYTIPAMIFPLSAILLWWFLSGRLKFEGLLHDSQIGTLLVAGLAAGLLTLLLYLPALVGTGIGWFINLYYDVRPPWHPSALIFALKDIVIACTYYLPPPVSFLLVAAFGALPFFRRREAAEGLKLALSVLLGCLFLMSLKIGYPSLRTWIYAVPVFLGLGSLGLVRAADWLLKDARGARAAFMAIAPLLVAGGLGANLFGIPPETRSENFAIFTDAPAVAAFLKKRVQPDDGVFAGISRDEPLAYYFRREGMPIAPIFLYIGNRLDKREKVWVVAKGEGRHSLKMLLSQGRLDKGDFGPPRLIRKFPVSSVYLVEKK